MRSDWRWTIRVKVQTYVWASGWFRSHQLHLHCKSRLARAWAVVSLRAACAGFAGALPPRNTFIPQAFNCTKVYHLALPLKYILANGLKYKGRMYFQHFRSGGRGTVWERICCCKESWATAHCQIILDKPSHIKVNRYAWKSCLALVKMVWRIRISSFAIAVCIADRAKIMPTNLFLFSFEKRKLSKLSRKHLKEVLFSN